MNPVSSDPLAKVAMRGAPIALSIKALDQAGLLKAVAESLGAEQMLELSSYGDFAWIPIRLFDAYCEAILEVVGSRDKYIQFWRGEIIGFMAHSALSGLISTARTLFGLSPTSIYKVFPRAWDMTYSNIGKCASEVKTGAEHNEATLTFTGVPRLLMTTETWAVGHVGTVWGILDMFGCEGSASMPEFSPERGRFMMKADWSPAKKK